MSFPLRPYALPSKKRLHEPQLVAGPVDGLWQTKTSSSAPDTPPVEKFPSVER